MSVAILTANLNLYNHFQYTFFDRKYAYIFTQFVIKVSCKVVQQMRVLFFLFILIYNSHFLFYLKSSVFNMRNFESIYKALSLNSIKYVNTAISLNLITHLIYKTSANTFSLLL